MCRICLVDDDQAVRESVALLLRVCGYAVTQYASARLLLEDLNIDAYDCLIFDMNMPGLSGLELAEILRARNVSAPVVMTTASPQEMPPSRIRRAAIRAMIAKPFTEGELLESVRAACAKGR